MCVWFKTKKFLRKRRDDLIINIIVSLLIYLLLELSITLYLRNIDLIKEQEKFIYEESWKSAFSRYLQNSGKYIFKKDNKWNVHYQRICSLNTPNASINISASVHVKVIRPNSTKSDS